ncbi:MAG TPA: PLP-dependent transferase [Pseudonocardiaceae bacterium]|nr:PLP-dependent transferase [Pseudonocardiaceae bacterium]
MPRRTTFRFGDRARGSAGDQPVLTAVVTPPAGLPARAADLVDQIDRGLRELHALQRDLDDHADRCRLAGIPVNDTVLARLVDTTRQAKRQLAGQQQLLLGNAEPAPADLLASVEQVLRYGLAALAHVRGAMALCAPSRNGGRLPPADEPTARVERQLLEVFGLSPDHHAVTVTSSGAAASTLVAGFLLRERLRPGDTVLLTPHTAAAAAAQWRSLPFVEVVATDSADAAGVLAAVSRHRPRCLFAGPLGTTAEQRMTDLAALLAGIDAGPVTVVVDGTALSAVVPGLPRSEHVEVLYLERGAEPQLGVDNGVAGVVVHPESAKAGLRRQRRDAGLAPQRMAAELFPRYGRDLYLGRRERAGGNALRLAELLTADQSVPAAGVVCHPSLPGHPDTEVAARLPFPAARVTLRLTDRPGTRAELAGVLRRTVGRALLDGVDLTGGTPRILSIVDGEPPFLAVHVGDRDDLVEPVARALAGALRQSE